MKVITIIALCVFLLIGCAHPPQRTLRSNQISIDNFWNYLNITVVQISTLDGVKLQIYSTCPDTIFRDVFITYTIFVNDRQQGQIWLTPQTRLMRLERNGRGTTQGCMQIYPQITAISGIVEYYVTFISPSQNID